MAGDAKSIEILLKNILDIVNKLDTLVATNDDKTRMEIAELKKDIKKLEELFDHEEILETLSHNISPEGFKDLLVDVRLNSDFRKKCSDVVEDVALNTTFRRESIRDAKTMDKVWSYVWKIGVPLVGFILGIIWWITQTYFFIKPVADTATH